MGVTINKKNPACVVDTLKNFERHVHTLDMKPDITRIASYAILI